MYEAIGDGDEAPLENGEAPAAELPEAAEIPVVPPTAESVALDNELNGLNRQLQILQRLASSICKPLSPLRL